MDLTAPPSGGAAHFKEADEMDKDMYDKMKAVYKTASMLREALICKPLVTLADEQERVMASRIVLEIEGLLTTLLEEMLKTLHRRQCWTWERAVKEGRA